LRRCEHHTQGLGWWEFNSIITSYLAGGNIGLDIVSGLEQLGKDKKRYDIKEELWLVV